jgi:hypothetical protein
MTNGGDISYRFAAVQFPIADYRELIEERAGDKLARPSWPEPATGVEWVRSVGAARPRPKGNPLGVEGESAFIDLKPKLVVHGSGLQYARLYGTRFGYRVDLGFRISGLGDASSIAKRLAALTVEIDGKLSPLLNAGKALSRLIGEKTTRHGARKPGLLLTAGDPLILLEGGTRRKADTIQVRTLTVDTWTAASVWALSLKRPGSTESRQLRAAIWRLHYEHSVLRAFIGQQHWADRDRLFAYLDWTTRLLARGKRNGINQQSLRSIAYRAGGWRTGLHEWSIRYMRVQSKGIIRRTQLMEERGTVIDNSVRKQEIRIIVGDRIEVGDNSQVVNRSPNSAVQSNSDSSSATVTVEVVPPDVRAAILELLSSDEIRAEPQAAEIANQIRDELSGEARTSVVRKLWNGLRSVSPVIGALAGTATLVSKFFGF